MQVKLRDNLYVNPKFVTSVKDKMDDHWDESKRRMGVEIWIVGNSGYGTFSEFLYNTTADKVATMLNKGEKNED